MNADRVRMDSSPTTLYERIGGSTGVSAVVDRFYQSVVADAALRPFFEGIALDKLRRMQAEFFTAALDGPVGYRGRPLNHAHHGLGITRRHFQAFVEHLFDALADVPLNEDDRYAIISRVNTYVDEIASPDEMVCI